MHRSLAVLCILQLTIVLSVEGVSMTITPSSMVVGSSSANPVTPLQLRCSSDGTDKIETVYRLEISRKRSSDPDFVDIAAINDYTITTTFPLDMRSPNATGGLVRVAAGKPPTSGTLMVTMHGEGLTCSDQAEFKCTMIYKMMGTITTPPVSESNNFTVITPPNDVRITDALYEKGGIQLQLTNNSIINMNTRIMYRCTANIGDDFNITIVWERAWSRGISTNFFTYTPTVSTDIVQDPVTQTNCSFSLTSRMYYNLTRDDHGITFRCKVRAYSGGKWYESTSAHHRTFAVHTPSKYSTVTKQSSIEASTSGGNRLSDFKATYAGSPRLLNGGLTLYFPCRGSSDIPRLACIPRLLIVNVKQYRGSFEWAVSSTLQPVIDNQDQPEKHCDIISEKPQHTIMPYTDCTSGGIRLSDFKSALAVLGIIVSMYQFMNLCLGDRV